jgi:hypothetical protein
VIAGVVDTHTGDNDTSDVLQKIRNCPNGVLRGPLKTLEYENLVSDSLCAELILAVGGI